MGKKMSGAQKRKKKKEKEAAVKEAVADKEVVDGVGVAS
jgi:hypothetical protein